MTETTDPGRGNNHDEKAERDAPNPETGVGLGAGEPSTFEPEEDTESVPEEPRDE